MTKRYAYILLYSFVMWCTFMYTAPTFAAPEEVTQKEKSNTLKKQVKSIRGALKNKKGNDALKGVENIR